jgi:hypothetical protein
MSKVLRVLLVVALVLLTSLPSLFAQSYPTGWTNWTQIQQGITYRGRIIGYDSYYGYNWQIELQNVTRSNWSVDINMSTTESSTPTCSWSGDTIPSGGTVRMEAFFLKTNLGENVRVYWRNLERK